MMKTLLPLLTALLLLSTAARADQLDDVLAQMPAKDVPAEAAIVSKLMTGGAPAVRDLCARLVPLGTEGKDDTPARYAVTALVRYAGRPGGEADRAAFVQGLCESLDKATDSEVKTFLINRLQETGRDDAVPTLAKSLGSDPLAPHASAALERIASPAAIDVLNKALPAATSGTRISIIKSLGMLRSAGSVEEIAKSLSTDDDTLKATAAWALANLGSERANDVLNAYVKQGPPLRRSQALSWMLLEAQRQAEAGHVDDCVRTCRTVMRIATDGGNVNVAGAVLHVLAHAQGDAALNDLLEAAASDHPQYRNAALDAAQPLKGPAVTARFAERLKTLSPAAKVDLLNFLAHRGDASARPAIDAALRDSEAAVRLAAVTALVSLDREQAIPALIDRVTTDTPDVAKPATEMLSRIPGDKPLAAAANALPAAPAKAKVALIELLAARGARAQKDAVLTQTADADSAVRTAALRALEKLAAPADAARLVELTVAAKDPSEESAALRAATAAAAQNPNPNPDTRAQPFLAALSNATGKKRATLERGLAKLGGKAALDAVLADVKSTDPTVREGAIDALAEWQDPAAIAPLLDLARTEADASLQVTALRGAVQVIKSSKLSDTDKAAAYAQTMSAAKRPEERKQILGAVGNEKGQPYFDLAAASLDQPDVQVEAALATIKTALPPAKGQAGLKGPHVAETLKRAIPLCRDPNLKDEATRFVKTLERQIAK